MRKFICLALVALSVIGAAGCGGVQSSGRMTAAPRRESGRSFENELGEIERRNDEAIADEARSRLGLTPSEFTPELEPQMAGYPGEEVRNYSKVVTVDGGYEVRLGVRVWEPVRFEGDYPHPAIREERLMTNPDGRSDDDCWVIPFEITMENRTRGFGAAKTDICIGMYGEGVGHYANHTQIMYDLERDVGQVSPDGDSLGSYDYWRENRYARVLTMAWVGGSDNLVKSGKYTTARASIPEGGRSTLYGYFVVTDTRRTPDKPNGVDLYSSIFAGMNSSPLFSVEGVARLDKNLGELGFAE